MYFNVVSRCVLLIDLTPSGSSIRHSPTSSSGESPVTPSAASSITGVTDQPSSSLSKEKYDSLARRHQLTIMQEAVLELQHQVNSLRAENAILQRTVDRCSQASGSDKGSVAGSTSVSISGMGGYRPATLSRILKGMLAVDTHHILTFGVEIFVQCLTVNSTPPILGNVPLCDSPIF